MGDGETNSCALVYQRKKGNWKEASSAGSMESECVESQKCFGNWVPTKDLIPPENRSVSGTSLIFSKKILIKLKVSNTSVESFFVKIPISFTFETIFSKSWNVILHPQNLPSWMTFQHFRK